MANSKSKRAAQQFEAGSSWGSLVMPAAAAVPVEAVPTTKSKKRRTKQNRNKRAKAFVRKGMPNGRSLLLELPGELRNNVYELVDATAYLRPSSDGKIATNTTLVRVSHQVRTEFLAILYDSAPIFTMVRNFDFGFFITFLNGLSERQLSKLPTIHNASSRIVNIELQVYSEKWGGLDRWLNRCADPSKKGSNLNVLYTCEYFNVSVLRSMGLTYDMLSDQRSKVEFEAIMDACHGE